MNFPKHTQHHIYQVIGLCGLTLLCGLWLGAKNLAAQASVAAPANGPHAIYLPVVAGRATTDGENQGGTPTADPPTPTATTPAATASPTATATGVATATPTPPPNSLPAEMVGTWYSGNAPLNDFYNPQTGEWRDANGLGQMYVFAATGAYTYTGFLRIQTGACRNEVSTFKQGSARTDGATLILAPKQVKTRTVTVCGNTTDSITEGPYDAISQAWRVGEDSGGREQLSIDEDTSYYKAGMANSLVGVWHSDELLSNGFYNPATNQFALESPLGMWFEFGADATYRFGERNHGEADGQGCILDWWIYHEGSISVVGSRLTVTPQAGVLRLRNSCNPDAATQNPWVDDVRDYTWLYRDRTSAIKLVLIPLARYVEFIFTPE